MQTMRLPHLAQTNQGHLVLPWLLVLLRNTGMAVNAISEIPTGDSTSTQEVRIQLKSLSMQIRTVIIVAGMAISRQIAAQRKQEKRQGNTIPDALTRIR